ncbi:Uncharacterised protein [Enterobacter hormaechei]|nr:Uncharacterised protein [Enterobacter hormaechei]
MGLLPLNHQLKIKIFTNQLVNKIKNQNTMRNTIPSKFKKSN